MMKFKQAMLLFTVFALAATVYIAGPAEETAAAADFAISASTAGVYAGNAPLTYDNDSETKWQNDGILGTAWIQYDLGSAKTVETVKLRVTNGSIRTHPIKIEVGNGSTFTQVWTGNTSLTGGLQTFNVTDTNGRYVKITMTANNSYGSAYFGLHDAEIWGAPGGDVFYVSTSGNDSNPGTISQPFRTIQEGVDHAQAGDTVYIRGGTYNERAFVYNSGTAQNKIVISGYPGETVIVDGQNTLPTGSYPDASWTAMVQVNGSYVELRNLTVKNSRGRGVGAKTGNYILIDGIKVNTCYGAGILVEQTSYTTVQNSEISNCGRQQLDPDAPGWPGALMTQHTDHVTFKGNIVRENYGEGIIDLLSDYTTIEDNIAYDNLKVGIYLDNSQYSITRRNLVYYSDNTTFWRYGTYPSPGLIVNDEPYSTQNLGIGQQIYNNIVYNAGILFGVWSDHGSSAFKDAVVANNTFVNRLTGTAGSSSRGIDVSLNSSASSNSVFKNNIVKVNYGTMATGTTTGIAFSYNNWSDPVTGGFSSSATDVVAEPALSQTGSTGAGQLTAGFFKLTDSSPGIDEAQSIATVPTDYFGTSRGSSPDMGAHEYISP